MPGFVADASATLPWCFEEEATPAIEAGSISNGSPDLPAIWRRWPRALFWWKHEHTVLAAPGVRKRCSPIAERRGQTSCFALRATRAAHRLLLKNAEETAGQ
jgi:hypothetical protein